MVMTPQRAAWPSRTQRLRPADGGVRGSPGKDVMGGMEGRM